MVTPILATRYKCDKCERKYSDLQMAADCEDSHFELSDFEILNISLENSNCNFPRSIHVANQKTNKIASYIFNHDKVKPKIKRWPKNIDDYYPKWNDEKEDG